MTTSRLLEYLTAHDGSFGCAYRYEEKLAETTSYIAGHYAGLLDDVTRIIGRDRLLRAAALDAELRELEERRDK